MDIKNFLQSSYSKENFIEFIYDKFYGFEENDTDYEIPFTESEQKNIQKYKFLGQVELDDGKEIGFFEFLSTGRVDIENNRVSLNTILKKKVEDELLDGAIAVFHNPNKPNIWRLSFIQFSYDENNKQQVSNLKRYTYVLGKDIAIKTAFLQLKDLKYPTINELQISFSVEKVSQEFFKQYKELYFATCDYLEPQVAHFGNTSNLKLFTKKLLGRIVFLYFLEKKGWLGSDNNWENGDKKFLTNHFNIYDNNDFYSDMLQPIFFEALNEKRDNDYFPKLNCKMPFLNGGLFSKDEFDKRDIIIENNIFKNIFYIFDSYNFTIIEDSPDDSEVAIDPEMLGRVFEDLLEDRKDKGAFYTPREIVHYMCQQSIINYLSLSFDDIEVIEELILKQNTDNKYIRANAKEIQKKLFNIKVLDPAIGSGAFPMGMLHEIVSVLSNIDKTADIGQLKRKIIEKSIYGIDIEQSAVEIAKLRFWLSIVVDEDKPTPLPNLFYKIMVGNSLIENINGFDPLGQHGNTNEMKSLKNKFHKFFNETNNKEKEKINEEIKRNIGTILQLALKNFDTQQSLLEMTKQEQKDYEDNYEKHMILKQIIQDYESHNATTKLFLYNVYFKEVIDEGGFDVVIGNPPYVGEKGNKNIFRPLQNEFKNRYEKNSDLFYFFFMKSIDMLKENGILGFITTNYFLTADSGVKLRKEFKNKMAIANIINFNEMKLFKSALGQHNIITMLQKTKKILDTKIINVLKPQENFNEKLFLNSKEVEVFTKKSNELYDGDKNYIRISKQGNNLEKVFNKMISNSKIIENICFVNTGFNTGADRVTNSNLKQSYEHTPFNIELKSGIFILTEEEYNNIQPENDLIYKCYKNSDIEKYSSNHWQKLYVIWINKDTDIDKYPNIKNHLEKYRKFLELKREYHTGQLPWYSQHWPREYDVFGNKDKIVLPYRSKSNIFSYSNDEYFGSKDILYLRQKDKRFNIKYILALLNSKLYYTWLYYKGKRKGETLELYVTPISQVPIKDISQKEQEPFINLVNYIIYLKENKQPEYMSLFFEKVIDVAVYELYLKNELQEQGYCILDILNDELIEFDNTFETIEKAYKIFSDKNHKVSYSVSFINTLDIIKIIGGK